MKENTKQALARAISKRLEEVKGKISGGGEKAGDISEARNTNINDETEELLRVVMVRYFPKIEKKSFTREELKTYFSMLTQLYPAALSDDLRYFDAMNNAYEAASAAGLTGDELVQTFLSVYRAVLEYHLKRLEDEGFSVN